MTELGIEFGIREATRARQREHPFTIYCDEVFKACELPDSQATREVVSEACRAVGSLESVSNGALVDGSWVPGVDKQAASIAETISNPQLEDASVKCIAEAALNVRLEGKGGAAARGAVAG